MTEKTTTTPRLIKIGSTQFVEDESTLDLSIEELRRALRPAFPELAYASVQQREENGVHYVFFDARPGHKG
jgi:hypothetical protein